MANKQLSESPLFLSSLRQGIWLICIPAWLFGTLERSAAAFADRQVTALDITQILTATFFLVSWLFLKPRQDLRPEPSED